MTEKERLSIGKELRTLRQNNNLTLKDVASKIDKTIKTVQLYETGTITISLDVFVALCTLYGVTANELLENAGI